MIHWYIYFSRPLLSWSSNFSVLFRFASIFRFILLVSRTFPLQIFSWLRILSVLLISLRLFCLISLISRSFLWFRIDVKQAKQCFFSLPSETKIYLQFQFSLTKRKRGHTLLYTIWKIPVTYAYYMVTDRLKTESAVISIVWNIQ
jgi:hypothetical protein